MSNKEGIKREIEKTNEFMESIGLGKNRKDRVSNFKWKCPVCQEFEGKLDEVQNHRIDCDKKS